MNAKQVWQAALGELQLKVPGPSFQTWLRNTSISTFEQNVVVIAVPSNFAREWLEKRFSKVIGETLNNILGHEVGGLRLPLVEAGDDELAEIRSGLERAGLRATTAV